MSFADDEPTRESSLPETMARACRFPDVPTKPSVIPAMLARTVEAQLEREPDCEIDETFEPHEPYLALTITF